MTYVRFNGRPRDRLLAFDLELAAGEWVELSDEQAAQLDADPNIDVTVSDEPLTDDQPAADDDGEGQPTDQQHEQEE